MKPPAPAKAMRTPTLRCDPATSTCLLSDGSPARSAVPISVALRRWVAPGLPPHHFSSLLSSAAAPNLRVTLTARQAWHVDEFKTASDLGQRLAYPCRTDTQGA